MLFSGELTDYLAQIDAQATEMFELLMKQMAEREGITERLKMQDQLRWVGAMNNICNAAEEIVNVEVIFV